MSRPSNSSHDSDRVRHLRAWFPLRFWPVTRCRSASFVLLSVLAVLALGCAEDESRGGHDMDAGGIRRRDGGPRMDAGESSLGAMAGTLVLRASADLVEIRARPLVDLNSAVANDPDASTAAWPIRGNATFYTTSEGVNLVVTLQYCRTGYPYPVQIYEGSECGTVTRDAAVWDGTRGAGISPAFCGGAPGARGYYARPDSAAKPWKLSGPAAESLLGRTLAVLDPDTREPLICGTVQPLDAGVGTDSRPLSPAIAAQFGGACLLPSFAIGQTAPDGAQCPDKEALGRCVATHCDLTRCSTACADYRGCLESASESCVPDCQPSGTCSVCLDGLNCALGFCAEHFACAPKPAPGGPCEQLEACCMRQGPLTESCLRQVQQIAPLGGDAICLNGLYDWDFNTNLTYRSPCYPDGGGPAIE